MTSCSATDRFGGAGETRSRKGGIKSHSRRDNGGGGNQDFGRTLLRGMAMGGGQGKMGMLWILRPLILRRRKEGGEKICLRKRGQGYRAERRRITLKIALKSGVEVSEGHSSKSWT